MKKTKRAEAKEKIEKFFEQKELQAKEVKKIKRLAMKHNIKLGEKRKRFCKKCYSDLKNAQTEINKGIKTVKCGSCGYISRWKIKKED